MKDFHSLANAIGGGGGRDAVRIRGGGDLLKRTPGAVMRAALLCIVPAMAVVVLSSATARMKQSPCPGAKLIRGVTFGVPALLAAKLARHSALYIRAKLCYT